MATYATQADHEAYVEGWVTDDPAALERILQRAERDIDRVLGPIRPREDTGLKLDPATDLTAAQAEALARAVCAQAMHRMTTRGEGAGGQIEGAKKRVKGPDFEVEYELATPIAGGSMRLSEVVAEELYPLRHLRPTSTRARA